MVNSKKAKISIFIILILIFFNVEYSYSQPLQRKQQIPSELTMKLFVKAYEMKFFAIEYLDGNPDVTITYFNITNSFISKINGRYCISVDYKVVYSKLPMDVKRVVNGKYSFYVSDNRWIGLQGWGPGE
jgi:hypothetical protein